MVFAPDFPFVSQKGKTDKHDIKNKRLAKANRPFF